MQEIQFLKLCHNFSIFPKRNVLNLFILHFKLFQILNYLLLNYFNYL